MKEWIERLEPFDPKTGYINAIVETPIGSRVKYAYDPERGLIRLSKVLPVGMVFAFNFGFIPQTKAEDGDPLDVLILNEQPLFAGCRVHARAIAVVKAEQTEKSKWLRNDRLVVEALGKERPLEDKLLEMSKRTVSQIAFFFSSYNSLFGKRFRVVGTGGPRKALELIRRAARCARGE
jgi:inorganic pyrophosphatase